MDEPVRVGIIGTGGLGTGLGRHVRDSERGSVVAVADVSEQNRTQAAAELGVGPEARYEDYVEMLDAGGLDAVIIATPHTLHYEQVVAAMEAGLDVLCEKPLTTDLDDARDLVERSRGDQVLMVGYQRHIRPPYVMARDRLRETGETPKFITAEITQPWLDNQLGEWRMDPDLSGGGQLYDTGSHLVDAVLWTTGLTPTAVSAEMVFYDDDQRVDTQAMLSVEFESETVANISVSGDAPQVREHIHIWSDAGAVYLDATDWNPHRPTFIEPDSTEVSPPLGDPPYENKIEAFLESVVERTEPPATAEDAFYVTAVTEAAYESARTGERVEVSL
ncbi:MAG: Gfo/Idh/MocA family protein [Halobacteriaceae archaeon]